MTVEVARVRASNGLPWCVTSNCLLRADFSREIACGLLIEFGMYGGRSSLDAPLNAAIRSPGHGISEESAEALRFKEHCVSA
jgi:hypothetical protein